MPADPDRTPVPNERIDAGIRVAVTPAMRTKRSSCWLLATGLLLASSFAALADDSTAARCPAYAAHLLRAKAYLEGRDQTNAVEELRRAREALSACIQQEADESNPGTRLSVTGFLGTET